MTSLRTLGLIGFFLGLAALEIAHGLSRLEAARERRHNALVNDVERAHDGLAEDLRRFFGDGVEHVAFLGREPTVRSVLTGNQDREAATAQLTAYLESFAAFDGVRLLDADGRELLECRRLEPGGIIEATPEPRLDATPDPQALAIARGDDDGAALASLDTRVLRFATRLRTGEGVRGVVELAVYAAPLYERISSFAPAEGVTARLEATPSDAVEGNETLRTHLTSAPPSSLTTTIPSAALAAADDDVGGELLEVILTTAGITLVLALAAVFFVRLSAREHRLREKALRERMEAELGVATRLGTLGMLTAGVAHEINNPLSGIGNYLSLLEKDAVPDDKRRRYLGQVRHGFGRIGDIVRDLLVLARPGEGRPSERVAIAGAVERAIRLVRLAKDLAGVELVVEDLALLPPTRGDAARLEQVLINLLLNAGKAMGGAGRIDIRGASDDDAIELIVEDDGPGIPREMLDKLFEPFESASGGTGLGLAIAYGIVEAHGGRLTASNRPEGGARFVASLPRA